ncbi:MAG: helix-turn-helix transcriptional regulator [Alphaproteobacteria bacterium]|nr:helix-turn-helix transcriptional regulator [Alphaproteobacteria bacterium]
MKPKLSLKKLREAAGLSQQQIAKRVGVSQPHYRRWEVGEAPIPESQLTKLAKILKIAQEEIVGTQLALVAPKPMPREDVEEFSFDADAYYGEIVVHFRGGGRPLTLSISNKEHDELFRQLQHSRYFIPVEDLSNQTVVLNVGAISDLWFSHDAADDFGPEDDVSEGGHYVSIVGNLDRADWYIMEALAHQFVGTEDFDDEDVDRVLGILMRVEGAETPEERAALREKLEAGDCDSAVLKATTHITYQLSNGQRRSVHAPLDAENVFEAVYSVTIFGDQDPDEDGVNSMLILQMPDAAQSAFINPRALDYIIVPTHKYRDGFDRHLAV